MSATAAVSYRLSILGYVLGLAVSALGEVPAGLLIVCATAAIGGAIFVTAGSRRSSSRG